MKLCENEIVDEVFNMDMTIKVHSETCTECSIENLKFLIHDVPIITNNFITLVQYIPHEGKYKAKYIFSFRTEDLISFYVREFNT